MLWGVFGTAEDELDDGDCEEADGEIVNGSWVHPIEITIVKIKSIANASVFISFYPLTGQYWPVILILP